MDKRCPKCETEKPTSSFNRNNRRPGGLQGYCRDCQSGYFKTYGEVNKDHRSAYGKLYREANGYPYDWAMRASEPLWSRLKTSAHRARKRGCVVEPFDADELRRYWKSNGIDGSKCFHCGILAAPVQLDHLIPLSRGGPHSTANVVPSCADCNMEKGSKIRFTEVPGFALDSSRIPMDRVQFADRVRRAATSMSVEAMADASKTSVATVYRWLAGSNAPIELARESVIASLELACEYRAD